MSVFLLCWLWNFSQKQTFSLTSLQKYKFRRSYSEVFAVSLAPLTMAVDLLPTERQHVYVPGVGGIIKRSILRRITHPLCAPACVFVFSGSLLSGVRNKWWTSYYNLLFVCITTHGCISEMVGANNAAHSAGVTAQRSSRSLYYQPFEIFVPAVQSRCQFFSQTGILITDRCWLKYYLQGSDSPLLFNYGSIAGTRITTISQEEVIESCSKKPESRPLYNSCCESASRVITGLFKLCSAITVWLWNTRSFVSELPTNICIPERQYIISRVYFRSV